MDINLKGCLKVGALFFLSQGYVQAQTTSQDSIKEKKIEEVVVVGYKTQRKETLTTSVASVGGDKLKDVATPNFQNALQGKMPGVTVAVSSGKPGSQPQIRIRGISSMGANNDPLYVVDGVIVHGTGDVPPDQIESVTILKDAAATALYGSRGAAGVVVITTKNGRGNSISASVTQTYNFFNRGRFRVMNSEEQKDRFRQFIANGTNINQELNRISNGVITSLDQITEDFDWYKEATQVGEVLDANITFSKSKDGNKTYLVGGYYKETGTVKGYEFQRLSARFNHESQINNWITIAPKLFFKYDMVDNREYGLFDSAMKLPWDSPYHANGTPKNVVDDKSLVWFSRDRNNYLYDRHLYYSVSNILEGQGNLDFTVNLTDKLKFISTNGITYYGYDGFSYNDPKAMHARATDLKGTTGATDAVRWTKYTNQMLRYENEWNDKHRLNALVAYEYMDYMYKGFSANAKKVIPDTQILGGAEAHLVPEGLRNEYAFQSILSNFDYSYDDRYLIQASLRTDQSSRFTPEHSRGWFWGISGGWNIHNESFFESLKKNINKFKFRGSFGSQGNAPTNYYGTYDLVNRSNYRDEVALVPAQLANKDLKWETLIQTNVGFDMSLFNRRLNLTFDWYNKDTQDLITSVPLSYITGFSSKLANIGLLRNRGVEFSFDADVIRKQDFVWNISGNIARNRTTFVDLYQNDQISGVYHFREGERYLIYRLKEWAGVNVETGAPQWYKVNDDGTKTIVENWNQATYQVFTDKSRLPDFVGGLTTSWSYKGFTLSANAYFSIGGYIYNSERSLMDADGIYPYYNQMALADGWIRWKTGDPDGTNHKATHPKLVYEDKSNSRATSTRYLEDASFIKIRNISLTYNMPKSLLGSSVKAAKIFMSLDNFFRFTKFSGMDPETGIAGDNYYKYPVPKSLSLGMNLTF